MANKEQTVGITLVKVFEGSPPKIENECSSVSHRLIAQCPILCPRRGFALPIAYQANVFHLMVMLEAMPGPIHLGIILPWAPQHYSRMVH